MSKDADPSGHREIAIELRRARRAVAAVFFVHGVLLASWAAHIPWVKDRLGLGDGELGLVLLALAVGAVAGMAFTGPLSSRVGPHIVTSWATIAMAVMLPLAVAAPSVALLAIALVLFGAAIGSMDVAMNAVAADLERRWGRPIMSSFHGMFSLGALGGSILAAALLGADVSPTIQAAAIALLATLAVVPALRALPPITPVRSAGWIVRLPRGRLLVIGLMAFAVLLGEGAVVDWSATLLREDFAASSALAALGFGAFSVTMAIGRFSGDRINTRSGPVPLVRVGGGIAAIGLGAGLLIGEPVAMIAGFALMGLGFANIVPILFVAAAANGPTPAEGISTAASLGYLGFLVGPPIIGAVAEATSLTTGLVLVVLLTLLVAAAAPVVTPRVASHPTRLT